MFGDLPTRRRKYRPKCIGPQHRDRLNNICPGYNRLCGKGSAPDMRPRHATSSGHTEDGDLITESRDRIIASTLDAPESNAPTGRPDFRGKRGEYTRNHSPTWKHIDRNSKPVGNRSTTVSAQLAEILEKINNGEGTLGKLVNDPQLYNNLDSLSVNLNTMVKDLNENPRHFLRHLRLVDIF